MQPGVMAEQDGVICRRQALRCGLSDNDIERLLRRRVWSSLHRGVYVAHTGVPTWQERAWAAVLFSWPAVLFGESALRAHGLRSARRAQADLVEVAIDARRRTVAPDQVRVHRLTALGPLAEWHRHPPRLRLEPALLLVASRAAPDRAVALLSDACQEGRTTSRRLSVALQAFSRLPQRGLLAETLADVEAGALSALERRYLRDVERAHALPSARRQAAFSVHATSGCRDVLYRAQRLVVELDGRLGHEWTRESWVDLDRDLDAAREGLLTVRVRWGQVLAPCRLAAGIAQLLKERGWLGSPLACGPSCRLSRTFPGA